jgi:cytidylate kinase
MNENTVITIGREFGSGGHDIGMKLAEKLGVKCYDKELLELAAKQSGLCEEIFASQDEKPTNSFLYSLVMDTYSLGYSNSYVDMPINHKVFLAQFDAIKKLAESESCVIVGRCADYALEDNPNAVSVFIKADIKARVERIKRLYSLSDAKATDMIQKTDKRRASYYNYYSSKKWGEAKSYDLCVDSGELGEEGVIELICKYIELKEKKPAGEL